MPDKTLDAEWCLRELRAYAAQNPGTPLEMIAETLRRHEAEQAVLLSEMTASREGYRQDAHKAVELATRNRVRAEKAEARCKELADVVYWAREIAEELEDNEIDDIVRAFPHLYAALRAVKV